MTPAQMRLVRNSFNKIEPISAQVGSIFYGKLFDIAPETRALFSKDMSHQHTKFMSVVNELVSLHLRSLISLPVTLLNNSEAAMPAIHMLGKRHTQFGVAPAHFELMRTALIESLGEVFGKDFTPELREAWLEAFDVMANVMKKGLENSQAAGPQFLDRIAEGEDSGTQPSAAEFFRPVPPVLAHQFYPAPAAPSPGLMQVPVRRFTNDPA